MLILRTLPVCKLVYLIDSDCCAEWRGRCNDFFVNTTITVFFININRIFLTQL